MARGKTIRLAMLHLAPRSDDVQYNIELIEGLIARAAELGANLILTPELAISGFQFYEELGKGWIKSTSRAITEKFAGLARALNVALVLGTPIYQPSDDQYFNAAVFIDADGQAIGAHYKMLVPHGGTESWATPGWELKPIAWQGSKVGLLICGDAYKVSHAEELARQGADVLLGLAAWAPGAHGPSGEWERCSKNTGLCFYVCNRTGKDTQLSFQGSTSIVAVNGTRKVEYADVWPAILTIDIHAESWFPIGEGFSVFR